MKLRLLIVLSMATAAVQAMEEVGLVDTPLHEAAKQGDYPRCLALLTEPTWMTDSVIQQTAFPQEAISTLQRTANKDAQGFEGQPQEFMAAMQKMSQFAVNSQKFMQRQLALAKVQQTALNAQLCTAYDCAAQRKASDQLLALLDPNGNNLHTVVMSMIIKKLGAEGKIGIGMPMQPARNQPDPRGPLFNPGDAVTIGGQSFTCTAAKKIYDPNK